jgi:hypothetical protein
VRRERAEDRVARLSPGHYQRVSLSPLTAIGDMVAPVVLITMAAFIGNGLQTTGNTFAGWVLALEREQAGILRGPHGEMLDEGSVPPADRERLSQIRDKTARIVRRGERTLRAILIIWVAIGLLVLSVAAIAVAATARSEAFAFTALGLVIAGVIVVFGAVASVIGPLARSHEAVIAPVRRTGGSG